MRADYQPDQRGRRIVRARISRVDVIEVGESSVRTVAEIPLGFGPLPPTGRHVQFDEIVILEIRHGKVHKQRGVVDNLSALRQLGVVRSPQS